MMEEEVKKRIISWLEDYPNKKGVVVLFDDESSELIDLANVSGLRAVEFATRYKKFVQEQVGVKDMLIEDL